METISVLPDKQPVIGTREIVKSINSGRIKSVIIASNCPESLVAKLPENIEIKKFDGDERRLGIKVGKPFSIAMVGYD